jgi:predicted HicB family RNase H-like nuclease
MICEREVFDMFEINKPEYTNKTFRMPLELVQELQKTAQTKDVSLNYLVIRCCEYALENFKNKE